MNLISPYYDSSGVFVLSPGVSAQVCLELDGVTEGSFPGCFLGLPITDRKSNSLLQLL